MKLLYNQGSPYARKVRVLIHETGLAERVDMVDIGLLSPVAPSTDVVSSNPVGKIPTLIGDDGDAIYDSRVICEFLDGLHAGPKLFPDRGAARWRALTRQALGDGLLDAAIIVRYENTLRPEEYRWTEWTAQQWEKVRRSLERLEHEEVDRGEALDIGAISIACALGYLDFRFAEEGWRDRYPKLAEWFARVEQRPSMRATVPA